MIKRKQWLDYTCDPEESDESCNKCKHLEWTDISPGEVAFRKHNADNQEYGEFHQLEKLKPGDIVYEFELFQAVVQFRQVFINTMVLVINCN